MVSRSVVVDISRIKASCSQCNLSELCLPRGLNGSDLDKLETVVKQSRPVHRGDHIFRAGDNFSSLYAVRSGSFKVYTTSNDGEEQVMGFNLPGEILGFDAIENDKHVSSAVALETGTYCTLPFIHLEEICSKIRGLQHQIYRLISREMSADNELLLTITNRDAEQRVATFLVNLSSRFRRLGYSETKFKLIMTRQEIGNYLGLTIETVSRIFSKLRRDDYIVIDHKIVKIINLSGLKNICTGSENKADICRRGNRKINL